MTFQERAPGLWRQPTDRIALYPSLTFEGGALAFAPGRFLTRLERFGGDPVYDGGPIRALLLLAYAYARPFTDAVFAVVAKALRDWARGERALAQIRLVQAGLGKFEDPLQAGLRLALIEGRLDRLAKSGLELVALERRELAAVLGPDPAFGKIGPPGEPRVPAGSGRESGRWTDGPYTLAKWLSPDRAAVRPVRAPHAAEWDSTSDGRFTLPVRFKTDAFPKPPYARAEGLPSDANAVATHDGELLSDPSSDTRYLMAPPHADLGAVYEAGVETGKLALLDQWGPGLAAIGQTGTFDFQRNPITRLFLPAYTNVSNYAAGVFMAGVGYSETETVIFAEIYALRHSRNYGQNELEWIRRGWEDAHAGRWK